MGFIAWVSQRSIYPWGAAGAVKVCVRRTALALSLIAIAAPLGISLSVGSVAHAATPDAPAGLTATADGYTGINLSWDEPTDDGGQAIEGYRIEFQRKTGSQTWGGWEVLAENTGSIDRTHRHELAAGSTRRYRVFAINTDGRSPASNLAEAGTDAPEVRIAQFPATAEEGDTLVFTLSRPAGATSHLMHVVLWVSAKGGVYNSETGVSQRIGDRWYQRYGMEFEKGGATTKAEIATHGNRVIGRGGDVHVMLGSQSDFGVFYEDVRRWERMRIVTGSPNEAAVTVNDSETATWTISVSPESTAEADTETVRATLSIGQGRTFAEDQTLNLTFGGTATKGTDYTVASDSLTVPAGQRSVGFDIEIADNPETEQEETLVVGATHEGAAIVDQGSSPAQAALTIRNGSEPGLPGQVRGVRARAIGARAIETSWEAPKTNGAAITGYLIDVSTDDGENWSERASSILPSFRQFPLTAKTQRHYRIAAVNSVGTGPWSDLAGAVTSQQAVWLQGATEAQEGDELTFTVKRESVSKGWTFVVLRVTDTNGVLAGTSGLLDAGGGRKLMVLGRGVTESTFQVRTRANGNAEGGTVNVSIVEHNFYDLDDPTSVTVEVANPGTSQQVSTSSLSVADGEATEGDDATLDFVVTLDPAASTEVTVDYATSDGTATAGEDYTMADGSLTPRQIVTPRLPYARMQEAYEMAYHREKTMLGVIFQWGK